MKVAIYARVSTTDQKCEMQLTELRSYAARWGWDVEEYVDKGFSGAKRERPALQRLLKDAELKKLDVVLVWRLDRIARSIQQVAEYLELFDRMQIRFIVPGQSIDTDSRSATAKLLLNILSVIAEFERDLIRERVNAGVQEYRRAWDSGLVGKTRNSRSGKNLASGRPPRIFRRDEAAALREQGMSWRAIGAQLGVPHMTVKRAVVGR